MCMYNYFNRVLAFIFTLQDGVMSPETDSGFLGSESSQLTPAVHSPLQQRAVVRYEAPSLCRPDYV